MCRCGVNFSLRFGDSAYPQQLAPSPPQVGSRPPRNAALIIAAAQPTPLSTCNAPTGQFSWHAPHSMHASGRTMRTMLSPVINTPWGQTTLHIPQLVHLSALNSRVLRELAATKLPSATELPPAPQLSTATQPSAWAALASGGWLQAHVVSAQQDIWTVMTAPYAMLNHRKAVVTIHMKTPLPNSHAIAGI